MDRLRSVSQWLLSLHHRRPTKQTIQTNPYHLGRSVSWKSSKRCATDRLKLLMGRNRGELQQTANMSIYSAWLRVCESSPGGSHACTRDLEGGPDIEEAEQSGARLQCFNSRNPQPLAMRGLSKTRHVQTHVVWPTSCLTHRRGSAWACEGVRQDECGDSGRLASSMCRGGSDHSRRRPCSPLPFVAYLHAALHEKGCPLEPKEAHKGYSKGF